MSAPRPARCRTRRCLPMRPTPESTLLVAIFSAFVGGLILNVMPCVLPILAMKALALAVTTVAGKEKPPAKASPIPPARC